ncbi:site-specific integrase [Brevundimonas halotolerans]|uniref:Integrase n=1 Tax=Brevundimonas halotolerans TaxID=69670 RepID=A0A7W9E7M8_9CAUL|nr:site-specific integrase [Brevundimonas halotolerans]MBB5661146.1 integrase [Brevundimonas halotolerans]
MGAAKGLKVEHGSYVVRMIVPADVRTLFGKAEFRHNLKTSNPVTAETEAARIRSEWKAMIAEARDGASPEKIKLLVDAWKCRQPRMESNVSRRGAVLSRYGLDDVTANGGDDHADAISSLMRLMHHAVRGQADPAFFVSALREAGLPDTAEGRKQLGRAILEIEHARMLKGQAAALAERTRAFEAKAFGGSTEPKKLAGVKISELHNHWRKHRPKAPKEAAKEDQYVKRLTEFMGGDVDIALISKVKAGDFWLALQLLPARRTSAKLAKLDFNALIATGEPPIGDAALFQWQLFLKALFKHAEKFGMNEGNPFSVVEHKLDKSELQGSAYTPEEIEQAFKLPLFTGHDGSHFRHKVGCIVTKDWKYWLPIASLWSGTRLNEWASAKAAHIKQIDGGWFLDLRDRSLAMGDPTRVKNKGSRRLVPIHQKLIELGLLDYAQRHPEGWLFPELHASEKRTASTIASNWLGQNRKLSGITLNVHELRHTFKQAARSSGMSEEISDLITGHTSGGMGRKYGAGVDPKVLTSAVARIDFPTFPL